MKRSENFITSNTNTRKVAFWSATLSAFALAGVMVPATTYADSTNINFGVTVPADPVLEITLKDSEDNEIPDGGSVSMTTRPQMATSVFNTSQMSVTVGTSNRAGYQLTMGASNSSIITGSNLTINGVAATDLITLDGNMIHTLGLGDYTCTSPVDTSTCNFTVNSWGYRLSTDAADTYKAVPNADSQPTLIGSSNGATNGDTTTVVFAAHIDAQQPAGSYSTVLTFTATALPTSRAISDLTYMQDFGLLTSDEVEQVKSSMTLNTPYALKDKRDDKTYWISKLRTANTNPYVTASSDNNKYQIWMTQDLDLNLETTPSTVLPLNSSNTDINSSTGIYTNGYTTNGGVTTWTPVRATVSTVSSTNNDNATPYSFDPGDQYYYRAASGTAVSTTCNNTASTTAVNDCKHWHIGNYYNWNAAVASNDTSSQTTANVEMSNSICPKGWKLPAGITSTSSYSDFNYLLVQYGIATNYVGASTNATWSPDNTNGYLNIQKDPLYILRSGYFSSSSLNGAGANGSLWSSTASSSTYGYYLDWRSSYVYPANSYYRLYGFPVRCIVRQ